jgi:hypothetical protein
VDDWYYLEARNTVGIMALEDYTSIDLMGIDPGLLFKVCVVLAAMGSVVQSAELWMHNMRVAAVVEMLLFFSLMRHTILVHFLTNAPKHQSRLSIFCLFISREHIYCY